MNMLYTRKVSGTVEELGQRLEKAIQEQGLGIIGMVDMKRKLNDQGASFQRDCRVYAVCQLCRALEVLDKDISLSTALPCRISIYEDNGSMYVGTLLPTELMKLFGSPGLAKVARNLEDELTAIIDAVVADASTEDRLKAGEQISPVVEVHIKENSKKHKELI